MLTFWLSIYQQRLVEKTTSAAPLEECVPLFAEYVLGVSLT